MTADPGVICMDKFTGDSVARLWRRATKKPPYPTPDACAITAIELNAAQLLPQPDPDLEKSNADARSASTRLLEWCRRDKYSSDLPHLPIYHVEQLALEQAILAAQHLMAAKPHRRPDWFYHAGWVWQIAARQLTALDREVGAGQDSVAIKFTCHVLEELQFAKATRAAVSGAIREHWSSQPQANSVKHVG